MALGIFTAGFLKGAADNVAGTIGQAAEDERNRKIREEERAFQLKVMEKEQGFMRSEREAGEDFQRENDLVAQANEDYRYRRGRKDALEDAFMLQVEEDYQYRRGLRAQIEAEQRQRQRQIEDDALEDLRNIQEQNRVQNILEDDPTATIAYDPSRVNISRPTKGQLGDGKGVGATALWNFGGEMRIAPFIDREDATSKETINDAFNFLRQIPTEELEGAIQLHKSGANKDPFNNLVSYMMRYSSAELTELLRIKDTNESNAGQFLYENPMLKFGVMELLPNVQDQKYFYENFFEQVVPALKGTVQQALGIPRDVEVGVKFDDAGRPFFVLPDSNAYEWATVNGELDDNVRKLAIDIAQKSRVPVLNVLGTFSRGNMSKEMRIEAMKDLVDLRESLKGTYQDMPNGRMRIFEGFDDELTPALQSLYVQSSLAQDGGQGIQNGIQRGVDIVRLLLPPPKRSALGTINVDATGRPDFENKYYLGKYGIDRAQAGQKQGFAQDTLRLIASIRQAQKDGGLIGAGGQIITLASGVEGFVKGLGDILSRMRAGNVNMDEDVRRRLESLHTQTTSILDQDQAEAQGVTNYLIEALAFAIAGSLQGGAKGNNISNQDIQNVKAGLNMGKLFSSEAVANGTLDYLEKKMTSVYEVNRQFANAANEQDFRAIYTYNMLMGHSYDKELMGSPYDFFRNDTSNPVYYEQQGEETTTDPSGGLDVTELMQIYMQQQAGQ